MAATPLEFGQQRTEMSAAVDKMALAWASIAGSAASIAHSKRTLFLAYVSEGFTEEQAMELVKSI